MNKRFCKVRDYAAKALLFTAICGSAVSCKDDYTLDDLTPSWLGSSIYTYLEEDGNYTNFVRLIEDLEYKEVLARTGSKTLFVANDSAFKAFYANNPWGVRKYEDLTKSQKKLLLNNAMINNAYLMEMMSSMPAGNADNDLPKIGECLRRTTAADITDSIPHLLEADLPISYNPTDKDYWARFRNEKGIYIALDGTEPMITHFLAAQLAGNSITDKDFEIITGRKRDKNDAFIYDSKVLKQDITCQNGYINVLDKVLINPQNMAEVIRTNEDTKIFSHMMDRFSAPFYSSTLTERYRLIYGNDVDSVYEKSYFSARSQANAALQNDKGTDPLGNPTGNNVNFYLAFDPGWNSYQASSKTEAEQDMGVIFCPTDSMLKNYFFADGGGGNFLIKAYSPESIGKVTENTKDMTEIYKTIDQIPLNVIQALINNLMKESFNISVPSKFQTIKNSAMDSMFDEDGNYHADYIKKVLFANNGIIYVMDEVITPADYASVSAPAYVEQDKHIFNWAIQRGRKNQSETLGTAPVNYYAYLLAMSSRFSFFVPNDDNFWYIDPVSFYSPDTETGSDGIILVGRAYHYTWNPEKSTEPIVASYEYRYDIQTGKGKIGQELTNETVSMTCYGNRLKDLLETHTIIHENHTESTGFDETETGVECNQHYFVSKNGTVIYIDDATKRKSGMTVKGGWQIENEEECKVLGFDDKSSQSNGYGNGFAYMIDQPMLPTIESVYSAMYNNPNFKKFFDLCQTDDDVLKAIGVKTTAEKNRFNIFVDNKGLPCFSHETGAVVNRATNVRFFSNYRYTVYVPTNEAVEKAEALGLPTWQDIRDLLELDVDDEEKSELTEEQEVERNIKAKAMATAIVNFTKYHFQDNSVFADVPAIKPTAYETASINNATGVYYKVTVSSAGNGTLSVKDVTGKTCNITKDKNIIARDYITDGTAKPTSNYINSSSSIVLHGIDGVLDFKTYDKGRYDSDWASEARARAYLKKYQLKD